MLSNLIAWTRSLCMTLIHKQYILNISVQSQDCILWSRDKVSVKSNTKITHLKLAFTRFFIPLVIYYFVWLRCFNHLHLLLQVLSFVCMQYVLQIKMQMLLKVVKLSLWHLGWLIARLVARYKLIRHNVISLTYILDNCVYCSQKFAVIYLIYETNFY